MEEKNPRIASKEPWEIGSHGQRNEKKGFVVRLQKREGVLDRARISQVSGRDCLPQKELSKGKREEEIKKRRMKKNTEGSKPWPVGRGSQKEEAS